MPRRVKNPYRDWAKDSSGEWYLTTKEGHRIYLKDVSVKNGFDATHKAMARMLTYLLGVVK